jgi:hypothetical protein
MGFIGKALTVVAAGVATNYFLARWQAPSARAGRTGVDNGDLASRDAGDANDAVSYPSNAPQGVPPGTTASSGLPNGG